MRKQTIKIFITALMLSACAATGITSSEAAQAVKNGCDWPEMVEVTDGYILREYFGLSDEYGDMTVLQCPAGAVMSEIIVIRSDDPAAACEALEKRRKKAIERDALYPETRRIAEGTIVGVSGDYAYLIMGENAEQGERVLLDTIG